MESGKMVLISEKEHKSLLRSQRKLELLEDAGVDNWEWYDDALSDFYREEDDE